MDAKSGSVLPTTPRIKGISMVCIARERYTSGKFVNSSDTIQVIWKDDAWRFGRFPSDVGYTRCKST